MCKKSTSIKSAQKISFQGEKIKQQHFTNFNVNMFVHVWLPAYIIMATACFIARITVIIDNGNTCACSRVRWQIKIPLGINSRTLGQRLRACEWTHLNNPSRDIGSTNYSARYLSVANLYFLYRFRWCLYLLKVLWWREIRAIAELCQVVLAE